MNANGKTSSRTPRWRCRNCSFSTVLKRPDVTRRHDLEAFINYATGKTSQAERDGTLTGRSFRQRTSWCWQVPPPLPVMDGVIHDQVFIDGIYLSHSWVILIATDGRTPLNWVTAGRENAAAYTQLLSPLPPPGIITTDGAGGALAAIRTLWGPDQPVQRCLVHVHRNNTVDLTHNPHTPAGKALKTLSRSLLRVTTMDEAAHWASLLAAFHTEYARYLKERTYASQDPEKAAATGKKWWYTHERDRRVYYRLERLLKNKQLFTFLTDPGRPNLAPTTNPIESLNAQIRALLRAHAGWDTTRQITAIHWFLAHHQHPINAATVLAEWDKHARQPHTIIPTTHKQQPRPDGPTHYDNAYSPDTGFHTRKGWAGRT